MSHSVNMSLKKRIMDHSLGDIQNTTMLKGELNCLPFHLRETHEYVMTLPESYYGPGSYDKWIRVGWALRNTHFDLFVSWVALSSQSSSFTFEQVPSYFTQWCSWRSLNYEGLSWRSIMYWSKHESYDQYLCIKENRIDLIFDNLFSSETKYDTISHTANLFYQVFKDTYMCTNIKNNTWYEVHVLPNQCLRLCETDWDTISKSLSSIVGFYGLIAKKLRSIQQECTKLECQGNDPERHAIFEKQMSRVSELCLKLKKTKFQYHVMMKARELLYSRDIIISS